MKSKKKDEMTLDESLAYALSLKADPKIPKNVKEAITEALVQTFSVDCSSLEPVESIEIDELDDSSIELLKSLEEK